MGTRSFDWRTVEFFAKIGLPVRSGDSVVSEAQFDFDLRRVKILKYLKVAPGDEAFSWVLLRRAESVLEGDDRDYMNFRIKNYL